MQLGCDAFRRAAVSRGLPFSSVPHALVLQLGRQDGFEAVVSARPELTSRTRAKYYGGRYHVSGLLGGASRPVQNGCVPLPRSHATTCSKKEKDGFSRTSQCRHFSTTTTGHLAQRSKLHNTITEPAFPGSSTTTHRGISSTSESLHSLAVEVEPIDVETERAMPGSCEEHTYEPEVVREVYNVPSTTHMDNPMPVALTKQDKEEDHSIAEEIPFSISDPKNQWRVKKAARSRAVWESDKLQVLRIRNRKESNLKLDWNSIRKVLLHNTPRVGPGQSALTLRGDVYTLQKIQDSVRADSMFRLVASTPRNLGNSWFGRITGPEAEITHVREHISKMERASSGSQVLKEISEADELLAHVKRLTRPSSRAHTSESHIPTVARMLQQLFEDRLIDQTSLQAFDFALRYLFHHEQVHIAKKLLAKWKELGEGSTISSFNLYLHHLAENRNLYDYFFVLQRLIRQGLLPTWETWLSAFPLISTTASLREFVAEMHSRGYMDHTNAPYHTSRNIVEYSFGPYLDTGGTISEYLTTMDTLYGSVWCSEVALHQLLQALGKRGRVEDAMEVLKEFVTKRDYACQAIDLNVIISHCVKHLNADAAVAILEFAYNAWRIKPDPDTYSILFNLFRQARMYNTTRVVWKYACMEGQVDYHMRAKVRQSLKAGLSHAQSVRQHWKASFGAFVCGQQAGGRNTARLIFRNELRTYGGIPDKPFVRLLVEALRKDKAWSRQGVRRGQDTAWKMENAIAVLYTPSAPPSPRKVQMQTLVRAQNLTDVQDAG